MAKAKRGLGTRLAPTGKFVRKRAKTGFEDNIECFFTSVWDLILPISHGKSGAEAASDVTEARLPAGVAANPILG
jgi:hypothetical protein